MTGIEALPWGVRRMKPFPAGSVVPKARVVLDPRTQTGRWFAEDGSHLPAWDRHKRSETSKETNTQTSPDGVSDQGSDQQGDSD